MVTATFNGTHWKHRSFGGASMVRVSHGAGSRILPHAHDWPTITICLLGQCEEEFEEGRLSLDALCVSYHPAGSFHANHVSERGLETMGITFDPSWIHSDCTKEQCKRPWYGLGGVMRRRARKLLTAWNDPSADEAKLARLVRVFLEQPIPAEGASKLQWLDDARGLAQSLDDWSTADVARRLGIHPAWLTRAYRASVGEGFRESQRRHRVEVALQLLRKTDMPLVEVAIEAGFCDQSHMNRCFKAHLDCTPKEARKKGHTLN